MSEAVNIAACLSKMAALRPNALALACPDGHDRQGRPRWVHMTFAQLDAESEQLARGLERVGICRGMRCALMVPPSLDLFALTFGMFKAGVVPVMVDPGMGAANLKACLAESEPEAFIGIPKAHAARVLLGWGRKSIRTKVTVGRRLGWGGLTLEHVRQAGKDASAQGATPTEAHETAAILFTSGSTGVPKGAVYSHENFVSQVTMLRDSFGIEPGEVDVPTFPLFALFDPALGTTAVIPDMDFTRPAQVVPERLLEAINAFGATSMFGSPALIDRLGRWGLASGQRLPSLRRVISAGAPVPATTLERFARMLGSDAQIFTPYGATEALPVAVIDHHTILSETAQATAQGSGVCVGQPVDGVEVAVIAIEERPITTWQPSLKLAAGEVGEVVVRGPNVTRHYHAREDLTALAKIRDGDHVWHRMGDVGRFDDTGRLWFCGRKSQRVTTADETLYTMPCEAVFNTHERVFRSALVGVRNNGTVEPVLCVELEHDGQPVDTRRIETELLEIGRSHHHTRGIERVLFHNAFPVDVRHNAKIFREQLASWAGKRLR